METPLTPRATSFSCCATGVPTTWAITEEGDTWIVWSGATADYSGALPLTIQSHDVAYLVLKGD